MLSVDRDADAALDTRIRIGWNKFRQLVLLFACSALTPLVGRQEEHPARKKLSDGILAWLSV